VGVLRRNSSVEHPSSVDLLCLLRARRKRRSEQTSRNNTADERTPIHH
jgi:hypothetical protein